MEKSSNPFFTLRCYGRHEIQSFVRGKEKIELRDQGWKRFNHCFDINYSVIIDYHEYILFEDSEDTGIRCIKVVFQDYSSVYAAYSLESFEKWLQENYLPLYNNLNDEKDKP